MVPSTTSVVSYGHRWATELGIFKEENLALLRERYVVLKENLVFRMDANDIQDPLSDLVQQSENVGVNCDTSVNDVHVEQLHRSDEDKLRRSSWSQYFTEESLLQEINTDLDRLYPAGNEAFFQNDQFLKILRQVLFVWCKLHPDVSYRQGMHDVVAVVFYAFLPNRDLKPAPMDHTGHGIEQVDIFGASPAALPSSEEHDDHLELPPYIEADTFLVFEAIMVYLKPFYEIVKSTYQNDQTQASKSRGEPQLFTSFIPSEVNDPSRRFGTSGSSSSLVSGSYTSPTKSGIKRKQPALHRLCHHVQYELLEQKDPQLYYHLQNLDIVPETYCLRWIRLLFAREFTFEALLYIWDGMIMDPNRVPLQYPSSLTTTDVQSCRQLPQLAHVNSSNEEDLSWIAFPLLRYLCVAKLLALSSELRREDNTGCLKLLMHCFSVDDVQDLGSHKKSAIDLVQFAQILQNPLLEQTNDVSQEFDLLQGVDVVQFGPGSLGIVLTGAKPPFDQRLAVKDFAPDTSGRGQAEASGRIRIGDLLESINGVPIFGVTTEEVKRHIQLIARPLYMGFRHCASVEEPDSGSQVPLSLLSPRASDSMTPSTSTDSSLYPQFLPGELCYANVETSMQKYSVAQDGTLVAHFVTGKFYVTSYRCIFARLVTPLEIDWQVPVLSIATVEGIDVSVPISMGVPGSTPSSALEHAQAALGFSSNDTYNVIIRCKDTQVARLSFSNHSEYSKLAKCVGCLAFPASLLDAFCFSYSPTIAPSEEVQFDLRREYQRIGLLDFPDRLRCIDQSLRYELCDTYPQHLIVPSDMSDVRIKAAAAFRSSNRLPVVVWLHRKNGATISRSSQPLVGLKSNRSAEDETLVRLLCCAGSTHSFGRYLIMDARGQLAAVGNKAMGKGTEITANYRGAKLIFMNIDNIHAIRQSLQSLTAIFEPKKGMNDESSSSSSFYGKIESSGWLRHVRLVLKASTELANSVHSGVSVLTHCSDGWDRTSQMVSLAELMLDPYYRTLRGFQCLIEKEWCSFGHQFAARCGHGRSDVNNEHRSPVFLLWLDCVWQFLRQFPQECEFNESLLLALADHVFSCKYGTFMFDCDRLRKEFFVKHRVYSMWSDVNSNSEQFTNAMYAPTLNTPILIPSTLSKNIKLWKGYFCRWDPTFVPPVPAFQFY